MATILTREEMLADYERIKDTLKSDAVKPVGGIGFVTPGMLQPRNPLKGEPGKSDNTKSPKTPKPTEP